MAMPAVVQIIGFKNRGKTTLVSRLVSMLKEKGYQVGTIKHGSHDFDIDHQGTDTWQHREAGADVVSITSDRQTAIIEQQSRNVEELLEKMAHLDIVLIEGFKLESYPKMVILRDDSDKNLLDKLDHVIGAAVWDDSIETNVPTWPIDDFSGILHMLIDKEE